MSKGGIAKLRKIKPRAERLKRQAWPLARVFLFPASRTSSTTRLDPAWRAEAFQGTDIRDNTRPQLLTKRIGKKRVTRLIRACMGIEAGMGAGLRHIGLIDSQSVNSSRKLTGDMSEAA